MSLDEKKSFDKPPPKKSRFRNENISKIHKTTVIYMSEAFGTLQLQDRTV